VPSVACLCALQFSRRCRLLLAGLLLARHGALRALAGPRVGTGPLTAYRKAAAVPDALVAADLNLAPNVGGVEASDGTWIEAKQMIDGGPSVLYDAVGVLTSEDGATLLGDHPAARDFIADAFAHCKFLAYTPEALSLLEKAIGPDHDEGCLELASADDAETFVEMCRKLRYWEREPKLKPNT